MLLGRLLLLVVWGHIFTLYISENRLIRRGRESYGGFDKRSFETALGRSVIEAANGQLSNMKM